MNLNKGISTPIAILIIVALAALAGGLVWHYKKGREIEQPKDLLPEFENAIKVTESNSVYKVSLQLENFEFDEDNAPWIYSLSLLGPTELVRNATDSDRDGHFGTSRDYEWPTKVEGVHLNDSREACKPSLQRIWLTFFSQEGPLHFNPTEAQVVDSKLVENVEIPPYVPPPPRYVPPTGQSQHPTPEPTECNKDQYSKLSYYPPEIVSLQHKSLEPGGQENKWYFTTIEINPFQYSPQQEKLKIIKQLQFQLATKKPGLIYIDVSDWNTYRNERDMGLSLNIFLNGK